MKTSPSHEVMKNLRSCTAPLSSNQPTPSSPNPHHHTPLMVCPHPHSRPSTNHQSKTTAATPQAPPCTKREGLRPQHIQRSPSPTLTPPPHHHHHHHHHHTAAQACR
ncbi:unnamed protein product [Pleuronectes platessa]|uniref:Uncharacterized protein n=1 Tax=Pleuronectes platessa TaxID=8262 RepID=A0A9N7YCF9_PLEPL|nr:unnamed protein product [Pleuronectes platessa]